MVQISVQRPAILTGDFMVFLGQIFLFSTAFRPALGLTQHPIQCAPGVKRPGCEAAHSSPSSTEIKNGGAIPPFPHMSSWCAA
jgi:hypothetical protein